MGKTENTCDCNIINQDIVNKVNSKMLDDIKYFDISDFLKIFSDSTRVKIIGALDINEMCVCDLANVLNMTKSSISHQLKILRDAKLVKSRREGKNIFYSLADKHIYEIFEIALEHISEL